jgi:hypothetical protein
MKLMAGADKMAAIYFFSQHPEQVGAVITANCTNSTLAELGWPARLAVEADTFAVPLKQI